MDHTTLSETMLFEKIEIEWFSCEETQKKRNEFRHFYREITDKILEEKENIESHIRTNMSQKLPKSHKRTTQKAGKS
jgi:transcription termination factor NusB